MTKTPYEVGDCIERSELTSWNYTGLSGKPGRDKHAVRRYTKGMWVLEVHALTRTDRPSRVVSIRTSDADALYWSTTRDRLMRHR